MRKKLAKPKVPTKPISVCIGIDQSLTKTAVGVIREDNLEILEYFLITSDITGGSFNTSSIPRLNEIAEDVMSTLAKYSNSKYLITKVGIEGYAYGMGGKRNPGKVFDLAELGGILKREIYNAGYTLRIVRVQDHVERLCGKIPVPEDVRMAKGDGKKPRGRKTRLAEKHERCEVVNQIYGLNLKTIKSNNPDQDIADCISIARFVATSP